MHIKANEKNVDYKEEEEEDQTKTTKETEKFSSHHEAGPVLTNPNPDGGAIMPIKVNLHFITLKLNHLCNDSFNFAFD